MQTSIGSFFKSTPIQRPKIKQKNQRGYKQLSIVQCKKISNISQVDRLHATLKEYIQQFRKQNTSDHNRSDAGSSRDKRSYSSSSNGGGRSDSGEDSDIVEDYTRGVDLQARIGDLLEELEEVHMTRMILEETGIGKTVNVLRKLTFHSTSTDGPGDKASCGKKNTAAVATALIKRWRKDVHKETERAKRMKTLAPYSSSRVRNKIFKAFYKRLVDTNAANNRHDNATCSSEGTSSSSSGSKKTTSMSVGNNNNTNEASSAAYASSSSTSSSIPSSSSSSAAAAVTAVASTSPSEPLSFTQEELQQILAQSAATLSTFDVSSLKGMPPTASAASAAAAAAITSVAASSFDPLPAALPLPLPLPLLLPSSQSSPHMSSTMSSSASAFRFSSNRTTLTIDQMMDKTAKKLSTQLERLLYSRHHECTNSDYTNEARMVLQCLQTSSGAVRKLRTEGDVLALVKEVITDD